MLEHSATTMNSMNDEVDPVNNADTIPSSMESAISTNNEVSRISFRMNVV